MKQINTILLFISLLLLLASCGLSPSPNPSSPMQAYSESVSMMSMELPSRKPLQPVSLPTYNCEIGMMSSDQQADWMCARYNGRSTPFPMSDGDCPDSSFTYVANINANLPNGDPSQVRPGCMQLKDYPFCYVTEEGTYRSSLEDVHLTSP